jgi:endonuclease YncB( thermonuclease family)
MRLLRRAAWLLLFAALALAAIRLERTRPERIEARAGAAVRVIDGDSLRIGAREIRLAGIDAPELSQTCSDEAGRPWPCGAEARTALDRLAREGPLDCTAEKEDRYGRALARCRAGRGDLAAALARDGWALGARDPRFEEPAAEIAEARKAKRGIWRGAHVHPADWRKAQGT